MTTEELDERIERLHVEAKRLCDDVAVDDTIDVERAVALGALLAVRVTLDSLRYKGGAR